MEASLHHPQTGTTGTYARWPLTHIASLLRSALQQPAFLLMDIMTPVQVQGVEALDEVQTPALFVANHTSHLDTFAVLKALPPRWRSRIAVAAAADYFYSQAWMGAGVSLLVNAFPFRRFAPATQVKTTLEHCAWLSSRGWSILLYPEGTRSVTGELQRFKGGVGMLAVHLGVPVIPVYTQGLAQILPKGKVLPRPGPVAVRFGTPLIFTPDTPYKDATAAVEAAVRSLACEAECATIGEDKEKVHDGNL